MTSTVYFAGSGADTFTLAGAYEAKGTTNTLTSILCTSRNYAYASLSNADNTVASLTSFWAQANFSYDAPNETLDPNCGLQLYGGTAAAPTRFIMFDEYNVFLWNSTSSSWTKLSGYSSGIPSGGTLDAFVSGIGTTTGIIAIYSNGAQVYENLSVDLSSYAAVSTVSIGDIYSFTNTTWNSVMVADSCTIGGWVERNISTVAGTYSQWSGTISSAVPINAAAGITAASTGLIESLKPSALQTTIDESVYHIAAVVYSSYVTNTGTWTQNQAFTYYNGTQYAWNYNSAKFGGGAAFYVANTAPDGTDWTVAKYTGLEYGIKSGPVTS